MTKTEVVITDIYDAWRSQDLDRLASYLPDDFCHVIYVPTEVHPLGGVSNGKRASLQRLSLIAQDFDFLRFDTSELIIQKEHAGVEFPSATATVGPARCSRPRSPISGPSRRAGRSSSRNIMTSAASKPSLRAWRLWHKGSSQFGARQTRKTAEARKAGWSSSGRKSDDKGVTAPRSGRPLLVARDAERTATCTPSCRPWQYARPSLTSTCPST
jgi:hypothetical protein